jgi:hypothetical protein
LPRLRVSTESRQMADRPGISIAPSQNTYSQYLAGSWFTTSGIKPRARGAFEGTFSASPSRRARLVNCGGGDTREARLTSFAECSVGPSECAAGKRPQNTVGASISW